MAGYQDRDAEIVDYQLADLAGVGPGIRGPIPPLDAGGYFTCLGAAQTFGALVERPFPTLLSEELDLPVLNLGVAGAGPRYFVEHPVLVDHANAGRLAIVQVMSGRSEDNERFRSGGLELLTLPDGSRLGAEPAYRRLIDEESEATVRTIVEQTRMNWIASYRTLFSVLAVPTVLLWFSTREPAYTPAYGNVHDMFGAFPQLVDATMLAEIRGLADGYVEVVSSRGRPQRLLSRFTGKPVSITGRTDLGSRHLEYNTYYPTPEMHLDASRSLVPVCRALIGVAA